MLEQNEATKGRSSQVRQQSEALALTRCVTGWSSRGNSKCHHIAMRESSRLVKNPQPKPLRLTPAQRNATRGTNGTAAGAHATSGPAFFEHAVLSKLRPWAELPRASKRVMCHGIAQGLAGCQKIDINKRLYGANHMPPSRPPDPLSEANRQISG